MNAYYPRDNGDAKRRVVVVVELDVNMLVVFDDIGVGVIVARAGHRRVDQRNQSRQVSADVDAGERRCERGAHGVEHGTARLI